jgi:hypothetical protein
MRAEQTGGPAPSRRTGKTAHQRPRSALGAVEGVANAAFCGLVASSARLVALSGVARSAQAPMAQRNESVDFRRGGNATPRPERSTGPVRAEPGLAFGANSWQICDCAQSSSDHRAAEFPSNRGLEIDD